LSQNMQPFSLDASEDGSTCAPRRGILRLLTLPDSLFRLLMRSSSPISVAGVMANHGRRLPRVLSRSERVLPFKYCDSALVCASAIGKFETADSFSPNRL
jgi:hypothetical protein